MGLGFGFKKSIWLVGLLSLLLACTTFSFVKSAHAATQTYYVDIDTGVDASGYGTSPSTPFKNIQYAADLTNPGDTVYVMNGTYYKTNDQFVFQVTRSGNASSTGGTSISWPILDIIRSSKPLMRGTTLL